MNITDVRVRKITGGGSSKLLATAAITIDGAFVVHDIKVIQGDNGPFIAMPSKKSADGLYRDIAHPITQETRSYVEQAVLNKYEQVASEEQHEEI